jgi:hypothetical protein
VKETYCAILPSRKCILVSPWEILSTTLLTSLCFQVPGRLPPLLDVLRSTELCLKIASDILRNGTAALATLMAPSTARNNKPPDGPQILRPTASSPNACFSLGTLAVRPSEFTVTPANHLDRRRWIAWLDFQKVRTAASIEARLRQLLNILAQPFDHSYIIHLPHFHDE